jgi:large subunit ribosomal protein L31
MKKDIHPEYRDVVFEDVSTGFRVIIRSTVRTREKTEMNGVTYDYYKVEVSSESHPFYTGAKNKIMDTAGRVEKFNQRYSRLQRGAKTSN